MSTTEHRCRTCLAPYHAGDRFCENCGAVLNEVETPQISENRIELDLSVVAAVSDRGLKHHRNEDSFRLEVGEDQTVAAIVCDGASRASAGNAAAREAARAAGSVLTAVITDPSRNAAAVTIEAIEAAQDAVEQVPWTTRTRRVDPSCTLVSAVWRHGEIVVGWVGDSRAYWSDSDGTSQLTVDDSFAEESVAQGILTPDQAAKSPFLHSITNWVGGGAPDRPPRTISLKPQRRGRLVLCTDGLWNYAATSAELNELIETLPEDASPVEVARALTDAALERGGHDNITVAVLDVNPGPATVS
jgi:serine/threonine protein phosphatase PrpC